MNMKHFENYLGQCVYCSAYQSKGIIDICEGCIENYESKLGSLNENISEARKGGGTTLQEVTNIAHLEPEID